jgi:signal transduction histidine kinase
MPSRPVSSKFKLLLVILAIGIVIGLLFYTQSIVRQLQAKEHRYADLYVKALEYIGSEKASENPDLTLITEEIIYKIDFPIIIADPDSNPSISKNIPIDSTLSKERRTRFLLEQRDRMAAKNPPLVLTYQDSIVTNYVYYDESETVKQLRLLPYVEIAVAGLFILLGYIGFSYIKRSEQAHIWVGMSKETAHQLGTPISSLLGWLELVRMRAGDAASVRGYIDEMETDVRRLNRIALRFSKIGSRPELTEANIVETVEKAVQYIRNRLPRLGRHVEIDLPPTAPILVAYNSELFEWVLENLLKNAVDAIDTEDGRVTFSFAESSRWVTIDVRDTGRGIEKRIRRDIFRPGFSTKKRGWGLGLSLSRRIVRDYHRGRLILLQSDPGRGTTFRIRLPKRHIWKIFGKRIH